MKKSNLIILIIFISIAIQSCDVDDIPLSVNTNLRKVNFDDFLNEVNPVYIYDNFINTTVINNNDKFSEFRINASFIQNWNYQEIKVGDLYIDSIAMPEDENGYIYNSIYINFEDIPLFGKEFKFGWSGSEEFFIAKWESKIKLKPLLYVTGLPVNNRFSLSEGLELHWKCDSVIDTQKIAILIEFGNSQWHDAIPDNGIFSVPRKVLDLMNENDYINIMIGRNSQEVFRTSNGDCAFNTTEITQINLWTEK